MRQLYPEIDCHKNHILDVGGQHRLYMEECGNNQGIPIIFLHGGPGSGSNENHRRYFNPEKYRIIIFDQRGCNRSTPQGCVENNTTQSLIDDMERIREHLSVDKWLIFGGSWGATLGLLYAETHPENIMGMILRGTFLARQRDLDWFAKKGANQIFPDYWAEFIQHVPNDARDDLIAAYHHYVFSENDEMRKKFARAWSEWAGKVVTYTLDEVNDEEEDIDTILNEVSIETHYAFNKYFISENQIINNAHQLPEVPTVIIHGRCDMTCTLESSWALHEVLPHSELVIVPGAGHLSGEPDMVDALINATDKMTTMLL